MYLWADGIYSGLRAEDQKLCLLVVIFPETRDRRCWFHKTGNVLNDLPKSVQPKAKSMRHEI